MNPNNLCMLFAACVAINVLFLVMTIRTWRRRVTTMTKLDKLLAFAGGALFMLVATMSLGMLILQKGDLPSNEAFCLFAVIPVIWGFAVMCVAKLSAPATEAEGKERLRRFLTAATNQPATKSCPFRAPKHNFSKIKK